MLVGPEHIVPADVCSHNDVGSVEKLNSRPKVRSRCARSGTHNGVCAIIRRYCVVGVYIPIYRQQLSGADALSVLSRLKALDLNCASTGSRNAKAKCICSQKPMNNGASFSNNVNTLS